MERRKFLEKAALGAGAALAAGSAAKSAAAKTIAGGFMPGTEDAQLQSIRELNNLVSNPEVSKLLSKSVTKEGETAVPYACSSCCLIGGGGKHFPS